MNVGGSILAYNCISQDYCLSETLQCLSETCDQISIAVCPSSDGTIELVDAFRLKFGAGCIVTEMPWAPDSGLLGEWLLKIRDTARSKLTTDFHLQLDADEVVHENQYELIRNLGKKCFFKYLNFWRDSRRYVTGETVYGCQTVRFGPSADALTGDGGSICHNDAIDMGVDMPVMYHYGFIKRHAAFLEGKRRFQQEIIKRHDPAFDIGMEKFYTRFDDRLIPFSGTHPAVMGKWLSERGFET